MTAARRGGARWMGPVMVVVAGMTAGAAPAVAAEIEIPEWRNAFVEQGVAGSVVVRRLGENRSFVSDLDQAARGLVPASTFKIPHLLIALETGVVQDVEQVVPWDGQRRRVAAWNRDQSVQQAVAVSSVPVFQTIARSIGEDRMSAWLRRLGYGNAEVSGGVDRFWLDGGLRVTPVQQVDFIEQLLLGTLPASSRSQIAARDAVPGERMGCDVTIHGKTGWAHKVGDDGPDTGWWVGWVERPHDVWLFATAVQGYPERIREARREVTLSVLEKAGILPGGGSTTTCSQSVAEASAAALLAVVPE